MNFQQMPDVKFNILNPLKIKVLTHEENNGKRKSRHILAKVNPNSFAAESKIKDSSHRAIVDNLIRSCFFDSGNHDLLCWIRLDLPHNFSGNLAEIDFSAYADEVGFTFVDVRDKTDLEDDMIAVFEDLKKNQTQQKPYENFQLLENILQFIIKERVKSFSETVCV